MELQTYKERAIAKINAMIANHGKSWKNYFVPVLEGMEDGIRYATGERDGGDVENWVCAYGTICRERVFRHDDLKPWIKLIECGLFRSGALKNKDGEWVSLRIREVNIGCLNRIRDPKCTPKSQRLRGLGF